MPELKISGEDFVSPEGKVVKFWGVNLVALYPERKTADALAANLASLGFNIVRPHHLLRPSGDWNPQMVSGALLTYRENSREFDAQALDRFDYLNAALRRNGIYLSMSAHFTRRYMPGDVDILRADDQDGKDWKAAMEELSRWPWQKSFDVFKMLPVIDERAALLNEEFVRKLLKHVNPYTQQAYAEDSQILTFEVLNESSTEYAIICDNKFPAYWQGKLLEKWGKFAKQEGVEPGDFYKPANEKAKAARARFLRKLDEDYCMRIKEVIRSAGCNAPVTFSNLWRGDNAAEMHARMADWMENHGYIDPFVVRKAEDGFYELSKNAIAGKPYFVGEFNQAEGEGNIKAQSPFRTMLPLAACAYGSLQNWSGFEWFAWCHGEAGLGKDGWATGEGRNSDLGRMMNDGMMLDHMRAAGMIFRRGLVARSVKPAKVMTDEPFFSADYPGLMRGKYNYKTGWQNILALRKAFGSVPAEQAKEAWMSQDPPLPLVSDTGEIVKDVERKQLTVSASMAEGFSGYLDGKKPAGLKSLDLQGSGFATVLLVSMENKKLEEADRLLVSRTGLDGENKETDLSIRLATLKKAEEGKAWYFTPTRPRQKLNEAAKLQGTSDGMVELPLAGWHEGELVLK